MRLLRRLNAVQKSMFLFTAAGLVLLTTCIQSDIETESLPTAVIEGVLRGEIGSTFYLDGSKSKSPDGSKLTFVWDLARMPDLQNETIPQFSAEDETGSKVKITPNKAGAWVVRLVVTTPDKLESLPAYATIWVRSKEGKNPAPGGCADPFDAACIPPQPGSDNRPPEVTVTSSIKDNRVRSGKSIFLYCSAEDPDGDDIASYKWEVVSGSDTLVLQNTEGSTTSFKGPNVSSDLDIVIACLAKDNRNGEGRGEITITVSKEAANEDPVAVVGEDQIVGFGMRVILDGSKSYDPEGDDLTYEWKQARGAEEGCKVNIENSRKSRARFFAPNQICELTFTLEVRDKDFAVSRPATTKVFVTDEELNPPIANAGEDQRKFSGETVFLDGSASFDPKDGELSYSWAVDGEYQVPVFLENADSVIAKFIAPDVPEKTQYKFELVVNDGKLNAIDTCVVTVICKTCNSPPLADAGKDIKSYIGRLVILDGSGSKDDNGDILTYSWSQIRGETVTLLTDKSLGWFVPEKAGTYEFSLVVDDGLEKSAPDTVLVEVSEGPTGNIRPIARAGGNQLVKVTERVTLNGGDSEDPDGAEGGALYFNWSQIHGEEVKIDDQHSITPAFMAPRNEGTLVFLLVVNDEIENSYPDMTIVEVINRDTLNTPPLAQVGPPVSVAKGETVTLDGGESNDPDGDALTYLWTQVSGPSTVSLTNPKTPYPSFTATVLGEYSFRLKVNDGLISSVDSADNLATVRVVESTGKKPPTADAGKDVVANAGQLVTLDGSKSSASSGASISSYHWFQASGYKGAINNPNSPKPNVVAPEISGYATFGLIVKDNNGLLSVPDYVSIKVLPGIPNPPPVANAGPDMTVGNGSLVILDGSASYHSAGRPLNYVWSSKDLISINGANTSMPNFIAPSDPGLYEFTLIVNDGIVDSDPDTVLITVIGGPSGDIPLSANPRFVNADGISSTTITGGPVKDGKGVLVSDGTCITVDVIDKESYEEDGIKVPRGVITTTDDCPDIEGRQMKTKDGMFTFRVQSDTTPGFVLATADAVPPNSAHGETEVEFRGGSCYPSSPNPEPVFVVTTATGSETDTIVADNASKLYFSVKELKDVNQVQIANGTPYTVEMDPPSYLQIIENDLYPETPEWDGEVRNGEIKFTLQVKGQALPEGQRVRVTAKTGRCEPVVWINVIPGPPYGTFQCRNKTDTIIDDTIEPHSLAIEETDIITCGPIKDKEGNTVRSGHQFTATTTGLEITSADANPTLAGVQILTGPDGRAVLNVKALTVAMTTGNIKIAYHEDATTAFQSVVHILPGAPYALTFLPTIDANKIVTPVKTGQVLAQNEDSGGFRVWVLDKYDNKTTADGISITVKEKSLPTTDMGGTLTKNSVNGSAYFTDVFLKKKTANPANPYVLQATSAGLGSAESSQFLVTAGNVARLDIKEATLTADSVEDPIPEFTVEAFDAYNNFCDNDTTSIVRVSETGSGNEITGIKSKTLLNGTIKFSTSSSELYIRKSGDQTIKAEVMVGGNPDPAVQTDTVTFSLVAGKIHTLSFLNSGIQAYQTGMPIKDATHDDRLQVRAVDEYSNFVSGANCTIERTPTDDLAVIAGSGGTKTPTTNSSGIAEFISVKSCILAAPINISVTCTYRGADKEINGSHASVLTGPATLLEFAGDMTTPSTVDDDLVNGAGKITVQVKNNCDQVSNVGNLTVSLKAYTSGNVDVTDKLSGTLDSLSSTGTHEFTGVKLCQTGSGITLRALPDATNSHLKTGTSSAFQNNVGAADNMVWAKQPININANQSLRDEDGVIAVIIRDRCDNPKPSANATLEFSVSPGNLDGGDPVAKAIVTNAQGRATVNNLYMSTCASANDVSLTVADQAGVITAPAASDNFNVSQGPISGVAFVSTAFKDITVDEFIQATAPAAGGVQAEVRNRCGRVTTDSSTQIALSAVGISGFFTSGTTTKSVTSGLATFADLKTCLIRNNVTLRATAGSFTADAGSTFNTSVGAAAKFEFTDQIRNDRKVGADNTNGWFRTTAFGSESFRIRVLDTCNNPVPSAGNVSIQLRNSATPTTTYTITGGSTTEAADGSGYATFTKVYCNDGAISASTEVRIRASLGALGELAPEARRFTVIP